MSNSGEAFLIQQQRRADAEREFLAQYETATGEQLAGMTGSASAPGPTPADRWKAERRIFGVEVESVMRFPLFQFANTSIPLDVIGDLLTHFEGESDWTVALWLTSVSDWLDGACPVECLDTDPAGVLEAARRSAEPLDF